MLCLHFYIFSLSLTMLYLILHFSLLRKECLLARFVLFKIVLCNKNACDVLKPLFSLIKHSYVIVCLKVF